ncbi:MAG: protein phosphatase 2C domain-containing protein [Pseudomonadota bacterium]
MDSKERRKFTIITPLMSCCGISDPGRKRAENEDTIHLDEVGGFVLLADGMGGHERGAEASRTAVDVIKRFFDPEVIKSELMDITDGCGLPAEISCQLSLIDSAVNKANDTVFQLNQEKGLTRYMGTTVVGLIILAKNKAVWFHVGDSRLYRWRNSELTCLTRDHSAYMEWDSDGRVGVAPHTNIITRAIGPTPAVSPSTGWSETLPQDIYLLCSDGLTDMISEETVKSIIGKESSVEVIAESLIDAANAAGGRDNVSAIVCKTG